MKQSTSLLPELPESAQIELKKEQHEILLLNGSSDEAARYIAVTKFPSDKDLVNGLNDVSRNVANAIAFGNLEDNGVKDVMLHMNVHMVKKFFDVSKEVEKKEILSKTVDFLAAIHNAGIRAEKLKTIIAEARKEAESGEEILTKMPDADPTISAPLQDDVVQLKKEIAQKHPDEEKIAHLTQAIRDNCGKLIGNKEIEAAQKEADVFIAFAKNTLIEEEVDTETQNYFQEQFAALTGLKAKANLFAIRAKIDSLGKELYAKTSKEVVAQELAILAETGTMQRFLIAGFFGIERTSPYSTLLKKAIETLDNPFADFKNGLGRFGSSVDSIETFTKILKYTLQPMVDELIIVHTGKGSIADVTLPKESISWSYVIDRLLIHLQSQFLGIDAETTKKEQDRLKATKEKLSEIKTRIKEYYMNESGMDEMAATKLAGGKLFTDALNNVPEVVSKSFLLSFQKKEKVVQKEAS
ncbi:MAG TPA: hypothetical protein VG621_03765 [Candidatus Paceibacterota bacterium]|nr:hypothetical protein [Candidatus Paceibacterota bacterium]